MTRWSRKSLHCGNIGCDSASWYKRSLHRRDPTWWDHGGITKTKSATSWNTRDQTRSTIRSKDHQKMMGRGSWDPRPGQLCIQNWWQRFPFDIGVRKLIVEMGQKINTCLSKLIQWLWVLPIKLTIPQTVFICKLIQPQSMMVQRFHGSI